MPPRADLLPGTLDLLILKAVSLGSLHGYAVLQVERESWNRLATAMAAALGTRASEV
jgi:hypothetical protein